MVSTSPRAPGDPGDRRLRRDAFWHYGGPTGRAVALCLAVAIVAIARSVQAQAAMSLASAARARSQAPAATGSMAAERNAALQSASGGLSSAVTAAKARPQRSRKRT
jgi:hypothetical protein